MQQILVEDKKEVLVLKKTMKGILGILLASWVLLSLSVNESTAKAQVPISRETAESRALQMINLKWTFQSWKNSNIDENLRSLVTHPTQLRDITSGQMTGIPYNWGGLDGIDSKSYGQTWNHFLDAVNQGAYAGNVNTAGGLGYIKGTAGVDCSGFVQAVFNIKDVKQSTSTLLNHYFKRINMGELRKMDILVYPGNHAIVFDRWGTQNGVEGIFTYEATPDTHYGGIQGTKRYFRSMNEINRGYIPARYVYLSESTPTQITTPPINPGVFAKITNVSYGVYLRRTSSPSSEILEVIPKDSIIFLLNFDNENYQITHKSRIGWVKGQFVGKIPSGKFVTVKDVNELNIRSNPWITNNVLGSIKRNEYAEVVETSTDGKWFRIRNENVLGWASRRYLSYIY
jgi:uncharacterized protein YraI